MASFNQEHDTNVIDIKNGSVSGMDLCFITGEINLIVLPFSVHIQPYSSTQNI